MYERKTVDVYHIMTNYGYGWECECTEDNWKDAKQTAKEYRENINGQVRIEKHRVKKEN